MNLAVVMMEIVRPTRSIRIFTYNDNDEENDAIIKLQWGFFILQSIIDSVQTLVKKRKLT